MYACQSQLTEVTKRIDLTPDGYNALFIAVLYGNSECVRVLTNVLNNYKMPSGITPLMLAAQKATDLDDDAIQSLCKAFSMQTIP